MQEGDNSAKPQPYEDPHLGDSHLGPNHLETLLWPPSEPAKLWLVGEQLILINREHSNIREALGIACPD